MSGRADLGSWLAAGGAAAIGILVAFGSRAALGQLAKQTERTRWRADDTLLTLLRALVPWAAVIGGFWAAALALPLTPAWRGDVDRTLLAAAVLAGTLAAARVATGAVRAGALSRSGISGSATIFANIARVTVLAIGLLILLGSLGVAITPLLTALGVGGLAVALALQDTLTNLFAGVHILASGKVRPGDYIQLAGGQEGYVVDTNWRNTTIRQLPNNLVIVPNATLADSVLTNYHRPEPESSVLVQVGVSYDSDLEHVERVTCEVGREVMRAVEGAVPGHEPVVRYHTFGESSVDFSVVLKASEITARYLIVHEFIKRLHARYRAEGIDIPFPIRTIVHGPGPGRPAPPPSAADAERPAAPAPRSEPALSD